MDFPMVFWLFWICFMKVLFKFSTNLLLYSLTERTKVMACQSSNDEVVGPAPHRLCDSRLLNYLMSRWTARRPASPWPTCTVYSVTPDYWTTWCPDELDSAQSLLDPLVQCTVLCDPRLLNYLMSRWTGLRPVSPWSTCTVYCTLWPQITKLPDVQMNWTPPSLSLTHSYSARVSKETRSMHLFLKKIIIGSSQRHISRDRPTGTARLAGRWEPMKLFSVRRGKNFLYWAD